MDDLEKLYRSRMTVLEMLRDRGYIIKDTLNIVSKDDFKKLFYSKNIDFLVETSGKQTVYVKWLLNQKIKPNFIKDTIDYVKDNQFGVDNEIGGKIIIISKAKPNTNVQKILKEKEYRGTELFWLNCMIFNITKHILVPKHEILKEEEVKRLLEDHYITNRYNLPIMLKNDPIARYFDLKTGDICRITRFSPTSGEYITYRVLK